MLRSSLRQLAFAISSACLLPIFACTVEGPGEEAELDEEEAASAAGCERPNEVVVWTVRHLNQLVDAIDANNSPCTTFFVSLPPIRDSAGRKTVPRAGPILQRGKELRASGVRVRAMAEFHWTSWRAYVAATGATWYEAGREFRRRMDEAGYDAVAGDTWAINEFPSTCGATSSMRGSTRGTRCA